MTSRCTADPALPVHHIRPERGWMNDPNGVVLWRGRYHVFYQYNPLAPVHDSICWGHASSANLVRWDYEPVALTPTPGGPDAAGCWSGCIVDEGEVATAVYTGAAAGPETATICTASSNDQRLHAWVKNELPVATPPPGLSLLGYRDPFVFTSHGGRYAVVGAGAAPGGKPMLLLYRCNHLRHWTFSGVLLDSTDRLAHDLAPADVWECPQLVRIGDHWVLVVSMVTTPHLGRVAYLVGDLQNGDTGLRFVSQAGGLVDHGHDFYAPAVLRTGERVLLWAWTWEDRPPLGAHNATWAGALTIPREVTLGDDLRLRSRVVNEFDALHGEQRSATLTVGDRMTLPAAPVDLLIEIRSKPDGNVTLEVLGDLRLTLDLHERVAILMRTVNDRARREWATRGSIGDQDGPPEVRIIIDGSTVELFVADTLSFTERVYAPRPETLALTAADPHTQIVVSQRRL